MPERKELYKGRQIVVSDDGDAVTLTIDGEAVPIHVHEDGTVESHDMMFQMFGSPSELARALVDQMPTV